MGYKRFNIGIPALSGTSQAVCDSTFVSTVSDVEIGIRNDKTEKSATGHKKKRIDRNPLSFVLMLVAAYTVFAVFLSLVPLPETVENFLILAAETVTKCETVQEHAILVPEVTNIAPTYASQEKNAVLNEIYSNTGTPAIQSIYDFSQSTHSVISNETKYGVDIVSVLSEQYPIDALTVSPYETDGAVAVFSSSLPEVLIIHTHGTECYSDSEHKNFRTRDTQKNVVSVGRVLHDRLTKNGISAIHLEEMFDETSYIKAYSNSYSAVSEQLKKYPSIKYVIDVHRDAVCDQNGVYEPMLFDNETARMMFVIGTDEAGSGHTGWQKNLRTAMGLQYAITSEYPGLMRNLNLRRASFNQQLCPGYFILEVGNCGNTLDQAEKAVEIFADIFSKTV